MVMYQFVPFFVNMMLSYQDTAPVMLNLLSLLVKEREKK